MKKAKFDIPTTAKIEPIAETSPPYLNWDLVSQFTIRTGLSKFSTIPVPKFFSKDNNRIPGHWFVFSHTNKEGEYKTYMLFSAFLKEIDVLELNSGMPTPIEQHIPYITDYLPGREKDPWILTYLCPAKITFSIKNKSAKVADDVGTDEPIFSAIRVSFGIKTRELIQNTHGEDSDLVHWLKTNIRPRGLPAMFKATQEDHVILFFEIL